MNGQLGRSCRGSERDTVVLLVQVLPAERFFLIIALGSRSDAQLISFDALSGALLYNGTEKVDLFANEGEALQCLKLQGECKILAKGKAALGYVVVGGWGLLLLAENTRVSAELPGGHKIRTVTSSRWYKIPCQGDVGELWTGLGREDLEQRINKIIEFPINGAYFFSETVDVTRPFPSTHYASSPSWQFVWNSWLCSSFRTVGLKEQCPVLLQGTAEVRCLVDVQNKSFKMVKISRRSRLNPGTRYIARGLNDQSEPGNEVECEQIIWRETEKREVSTPWCRYLWRRGTVPIRWGVNLKNNGLGEAEIIIRREQTFKGIRRYIRRLQKHCTHPVLGSNAECGQFSESSSTDSTDVGAKRSSGAVDTSINFPVVFVSLLRKGTPDRDRSEAKLASAFDVAVNALRRENQLPATYFSIDWHEMDKQLGTEGVIEALWSTMKPVLEAHGMEQGECILSSCQGKGSKDGEQDGSRYAPWGASHCMKWSSHQMGVNRYNCADSLDRTNVASFFVAAQALVEQCRCLDLHIVTQGEGFTTGERIHRGLRDRLMAGRHHGCKHPAAAAATSHKFLGQQAGGGWGRFGRQGQQTEAQAKGQMESSTKAVKTSLPEGWEMRSDDVTGMVYYIDHIKKRTSWTPPVFPSAMAGDSLGLASSSSTPNDKVAAAMSGQRADGTMEKWHLLSASVEHFRRRVQPDVLSSLAELFLINGDRNAFLYTGSQAMHSDKILVFEPENSPLRKAGVSGASNSLIAIARRYNNIVRDNDRQAQIEMFLGLNPGKHFNCQTTEVEGTRSVRGPLLYLSQQQVPMDYPDTDDEDDPINQLSFPPSRAKSPLQIPAMPLTKTTASLSVPNLSAMASRAADLHTQPRDDASIQGTRLSSEGGNAGGWVDVETSLSAPVADANGTGRVSGSTKPLELQITLDPDLNPLLRCAASKSGVDGLRRSFSQGQWQSLQEGLREVSVDLGPLER